MPALSGDDPRAVGAYRLVERIGAGGMGVVYRATTTDGTTVAVKVIRSEFADDQEFRRRFAREVEACKSVKGHCTARVLAADVTPSRPYLVTEYVPGPNLSEYISEHGPMPAAPLRALATGLAEALSSIHAAGLIHRDLKPANVLLSPAGPKVIDFGIVAAADAVTLTRSGHIVGSPGWMAPEQVSGARDNAAIDVFAWGLLVAYAATGRAPFGEGRPEAVLYRIVHNEPDLAGIDPAFLQLIKSALDKDPARRPTADDLLAQLLGGAVQDPASAATVLIARDWTPTLALTSTLRPQPTGDHHAARRRWPLVAAVVAVVVIAAGGTAFALDLTQQRKGPPTVSLHGPTFSTSPTAAAAPTSRAAAISTAPAAPTARSSTPTGAPAPPTLAATDVQVYNPFAPDGITPRFRISFAAAGNCQSSIADARPDAYRCFLNQNEPDGDNIEDPCFVAPNGPATVLLCTHDPAGTTLVEVTSTQTLPPPVADSKDPLTGTPWALVLANGQHCVMITGGTQVLAGMRLNYGCDNGGNVYGDPDRTTAVWRVYYVPNGVSDLHQAQVAQAYF